MEFGSGAAPAAAEPQRLAVRRERKARSDEAALKEISK